MLLNSTPQPHEAPALASEYQWPSVLIPGACFQRTLIVDSGFSKLLLCLVNSCKPHHTVGFRVNPLLMIDLKLVSLNFSV